MDKRRCGRPRNMWLDNIKDWTWLSVDDSGEALMPKGGWLKNLFVHPNEFLVQGTDDEHKLMVSCRWPHCTVINVNWQFSGYKTTIVLQLFITSCYALSLQLVIATWKRCKSVTHPNSCLHSRDHYKCQSNSKSMRVHGTAVRAMK